MRRVIAGCLSAGLALTLLTAVAGSSLAFPLEKLLKGSRNDQPKKEPRIVVETMDAGDYTYVKIKTGDESYWLAAPRVAVSIGDRVTHPRGVTMYDFESPTLKRKFETVLFVDRLVVVEKKPSKGERIAAAHRRINDEEVAGSLVAPGSVEKAKGGYTVAELYEKARSLRGKRVTLRGKVVKYHASIMGRNWIHLRDGTGEAPANDITVTTAGEAKVGDILLVEGELAVDKNFGAGYTYPVIIEDAELTVQK